ncbi:MAG: hypothetical protein V3T31_06755 [candidate division Zixibacteria bacterium]
MKRSKVSALWLMLALLTLCFISAPVFSGEHPWDADDPGQGGEPGTGGDGDTDTTIIVIGDDITGPGGGDPVGLNPLLSQLSRWMLFGLSHGQVQLWYPSAYWESASHTERSGQSR